MVIVRVSLRVRVRVRLRVRIRVRIRVRVKNASHVIIFGLKPTPPSTLRRGKRSLSINV